MTDRSIVSACSLGLSGSAFLGSGLPVTGLSGLGMPAIERNERPTKALEAVAAGKAKAFAFAATGAGVEQRQKTTYHHTMWAFRGLEPWSDPV
ncbi:hypothetical protein ABZY68_13820 [Streptomyces sp. NPDC006482]|uniref:hypothetical protein n=1 Tax=unclassified Streptomyces TaxID=2593676 RepID=UPI00224D04DC|nr:hypothetical protein [Streptomyces sp. NBC_00094]MCX5393056.1 hypothetical protein [Streptomyces sp. NBC_00094]